MPCGLPPDMLTKDHYSFVLLQCCKKTSDADSGVYYSRAAVLLQTELTSSLVCRTESPSARLGTPSAFHQVFGTTSGTTPGTDYHTTPEATSASSRRGLSQHTQSALISTGQHRLAASLSDLPHLPEHAEGEQDTIRLACTAGVNVHAKLCLGVLLNIS